MSIYICPHCGRKASNRIKNYIVNNETEVLLNRYCFWCNGERFELHYIKHYKTIDGYIGVNVPVLCKAGYFVIKVIGEHRWIWEQVFGKLPKGWMVHHINGIKTDNRLENLIAMPKKSHNNVLQDKPIKVFNVVCPYCAKEFSAWMPMKIKQKVKTNQLLLPV